MNHMPQDFPGAVRLPRAVSCLLGHAPNFLQAADVVTRTLRFAALALFSLGQYSEGYVS
jgi:hypothetical protein